MPGSVSPTEDPASLGIMNVELDKDMEQRLVQLAHRQGKPAEALLRELLELAFSQLATRATAARDRGEFEGCSCFDLAVASGAIGVLEDAPPGLSSCLLYTSPSPRD